MRRRRFISTALLVSSFGIFLSGCRSSGRESRASDAEISPPYAPTGRPIELLTWWPKVGDSDSIGALSAAHRHHHPADVLIDATADLSGQARSTLQRRMQRDEPPDTFMGNAGRDFMRWIFVDGVDDAASKLMPLDGLVDVPALRESMPKSLLDLLTHEGQLYGVPANIHRLNTIFYNRSVFRRYGLSEPRTLADLPRLNQKLSGSGVHLLALGSREPWTLELLAFECLLIAREGPAYYESYFHGHLRADDPPVMGDLEAFLDLLDVANEDHAQLTWLQAVDLVASGKAAMTVMGDWARGAFANHGMKIGEDYSEIPFPGTEDVFVFTSDTFGLPKFAKNPEGAARLLTTIGSIEGQRALNGAADALSSRLDVPPVGDSVLETEFALFKKGPLVLALSGLVPARFAEDVAVGLADAAAQHDIEPASHTLRSRYALLR